MGSGVGGAAPEQIGGEIARADLPALAARICELVPPGGVLWLSGDLGTGKTTVVQHICQALGAEAATSPTYALVHEYRAPGGPVYHVDCYRLTHPAEALDLDLEALAASGRLLCVEWPERAGPYAPPPSLHVELDHHADPDCRRVRLIVP